jgi:signal transduction histidine kinase
MFRSIRSRLALSFAGIALVAAIVLGAVLLAILRDYFQNQELDYLRINAKSIGTVVSSMMAARAPQQEIQAQVKSLAFLSQTRIEVYDASGQLLYDSGSPQNAKVSLAFSNLGQIKDETVPSKDMVFITVGGDTRSAPVPQADGSTLPGKADGNVTSVPVPKSDGPMPSGLPTPGTKGLFVYRSVQAGSSPFGFQITLNGESSAAVPRSNLDMLMAVQDLRSQQVLGSIQLSEGPAYGTVILKSVARGWMLASAVAVLLAAALGWLISRRISAPVRELTVATARMAQGDLTSRASVRSRDEIGQLSRSFNEMADQVEGTVTTLRQFVSDASHELRTPLTALRTNLDLALGEMDGAERDIFLARAQAMVQRLETLNSSLLDLSRLEANRRAESMEMIDWAELLRERVEAYASQAEQGGLSFDMDVPDTPVFVEGHMEQIARAMDNLVDNACKFTHPGGRLEVKLSSSDSEATFSVADDGIGIPADDLPQIFNRFHRGRNTSAYPGSGLGLAIVRAITVVQGGKVEARSSGEGKGSEFAITLPFVTSGKRASR